MIQNDTWHEVKTYWGWFRLDEGAYRDYLDGKLWISANPCPNGNVIKRDIRSQEIPVNTSQKAIELKNEAAYYGFICTLQSLNMEADIPVPYKSYMAETGIEELNLSVRASNGLMRAGIKNFGKLKALIETERGISSIRNLGEKSVKEINTAFLTATYLRLSNGEKAAYWQQIIDKTY